MVIINVFCGVFYFMIFVRVRYVRSFVSSFKNLVCLGVYVGSSNSLVDDSLL